MQLVPPKLDDILGWLVPKANMKSVGVVVAKLVFAASTYFIWQERNLRLFEKKKRKKEQVIELILNTVRLKLLSFWYKKTRRAISMRVKSDLPNTLIHDGG